MHSQTVITNLVYWYRLSRFQIGLFSFGFSILRLRFTIVWGSTQEQINICPAARLLEECVSLQISNMHTLKVYGILNIQCHIREAFISHNENYLNYPKMPVPVLGNHMVMYIALKCVGGECKLVTRTSEHCCTLLND